jgi:cytochrome b561
MTNQNVAPGRQDSTSTWLGTVLFLVFVVLLAATIMVPRTPVGERDFLHSVHFSTGLTILVLIVWRFVHLRGKGRVRPPENMPAAAFGFSRMILNAILLTFVVTTFLGFAYAWSNGHEVIIYGIQLPHLVPKSYEIKNFAGYFHSTLGFYYMGVAALWLVVGVVHHVRYRCGLLRLFPGSRV